MYHRKIVKKNFIQPVYFHFFSTGIILQLITFAFWPFLKKSFLSFYGGIRVPCLFFNPKIMNDMDDLGRVHPSTQPFVVRPSTVH